jgi:photosystem II stability/assembly factor-like uncharacterized protein
LKKIFFLFTFFIFSSSLFAQSWHLLTNSPAQTFRHDDLYFINADTGWVINVSGQVWRTNDGGNTWNKLIQQSSSFRCVGFFDSIHGCIGNLGPGNWAPTNDTNPLYVTSDGGKTLSLPIIIGPKPKGICGMSIINDTAIAACGRFDGPPYFGISTDRGNTWHTKNMKSVAGMLIDAKFISPDTGFIVGGTDSNESISRSLILYTTDAGNTWTKKIIGAVKGNHCWKISHPSKNVFYVSVEELYSGDTLKFFKSTDGGATWAEHVVATTKYGWSQGIGFVNDTVGWIGGDTYALTTSDSGNTFTNVSPSNLLVNLNRIRFINDTVGYAVGQRVYKYCKYPPATLQEVQNTMGYSLEQNHPNPFSVTTTITYSIPASNHVLIEVFDAAGRKVKTVVNETKTPGTYHVEFTLPHPGNGALICAMISGPFSKRIKMISVK